MIELFYEATLNLFQPATLAWLVFGTAVGIVFGSIPGLTTTMAVALFLPITYALKAEVSLPLLVALFVGGTSGGLISAILLKIPGTPSSIATTFDGAPMMEKGEAFKALGVGIVFSFIGTLISLVVLVFVAPTLADFALQFGPQEYFAVVVFSVALIATLSSKNYLRGLFSGVLGITLATVGIAPVDAIRRFTFGITSLNSGFSILVAMIGLFAVTEIVHTASTIRIEGKTTILSVKRGKGFGFSIAEGLGQAWNCIRSALIGVGIGILPGIGGGTSNILSYIVAKNRSKHPEKFGTGIIDGVVASETANNASIGGALVPLLTLGIPGDAVTAVMLGGFLIQGIQPGPLLFVSQAPLVYSIFAALLLSAIMMLILEFYGLRLFIKVLAVPKHILMPIIFMLCVVGAYGLNNRMFDVWIILLFGLIGYLCLSFKIELTPLIIGFVLGPLAETNLRRGLQLTDGSFLQFFMSPIAAVFMVLALATLGWSMRKAWREHTW